MDIIEFITLVSNARHHQLQYLKFKQPQDLMRAIKLEMKIDQVLSIGEFTIQEQKIENLAHRSSKN